MARSDRRLLRALVAELRRIPDGDANAVARRARISRRQFDRIRAGKADLLTTTMTRLADALGIAIVIGPPRRAAPIGKRAGKPRGIRREPNVGESHDHEEDAPIEREEV